MEKTAYITIRKEKCKGCKLCMVSCAHGLISADEAEINALGYMPVKFDDPEDKCKGCKLCAEMCPDFCIEVYKKRGSK